MFGNLKLLAKKESAKLTLIRVAEGSAIVALFLILVLLLEGLVLAVEYRKVDVINVVQVPGADASKRLVVVDLGDRHYPIRTSDRLLIVAPGKWTCVSKRHVLLRRWAVYKLELPGYCRNALPVGSYSSQIDFRSGPIDFR